MKRALLLGLSTAVSLVLVEALVRACVDVPYRPLPAEVTGGAWTRLLHRPSPIPGLGYEMAPDRRLMRNGHLLATNSLGLRDDEPRPGAERRLAVLGDSFSFGLSVDAEHIWPNVLERLLRGVDPGAEVLNFSVSGYSLRDEVTLLRHRVLTWSPGVVVFGYYLNDPELDTVQPLHNHFAPVRWWQHSHFLRLVAQARRDLAVERCGQGDMYRYLHNPSCTPWKETEATLDDLRSLVAGRGDRAGGPPPRVLFVILPEPPLAGWAAYAYREIHRRVFEAVRGRGFDALDMLPIFERHPAMALRIDRRDHHPSRLAHELIARAVMETLAGPSFGDRSAPR